MRRRWITGAFLIWGAWGALGGIALGQVLGATARDRAVDGGKAFLARRGLKSVGLRLVVPRRYARAVGDEIQEFERRTGIGVREYVEVDGGKVPERLRAAGTTKAGRVDLFLAPLAALPEAAEARVLLPLDDFIRAGRPDLDLMVPAFRDEGRYRGKTYGLFADGEMLVLALRRDLMALPAERATFKRRFGWEPDCPTTWLRWRQLAEFYTRESTDKKFSSYYGALGLRSRGHGWRWWLQRYYSMGKLPFDRQMAPTLGSAEALKTTREYIGITRFMPEETRDWAKGEGVAAFLKGNVFSILTYQSAIRAVNGPGGSKVAGKVKFCAVPGSLVQGGPFRRALQVNGFAWMINRYGRYPEAAYWLIQWLTSGQVSANLAARPGSGFSPTQAGHFEQPKVVGALTPELTAILAKLTQVAVPEMLLVGADRYHEALDRNLFAALAGEISPEEAMKRTADAWETITEEVGRKRQREAWRGFLQRLPKKDVPD